MTQGRGQRNSAGRFETDFPLMSVAQVKAAVKQARARGVSKVARSRRGFATAYIKAGAWRNLPDSWRRKRENFIKRHLAQALNNDEELADRQGRPSRRALAIQVWAFDPLDFGKPDLRAMMREAGI